jgi:hypothetical protein
LNNDKENHKKFQFKIIYAANNLLSNFCSEKAQKKCKIVIVLKWSILLANIKVKIFVWMKWAQYITGRSCCFIISGTGFHQKNWVKLLYILISLSKQNYLNKYIITSSSVLRSDTLNEISQKKNKIFENKKGPMKNKQQQQKNKDFR